MEFGLILSLQSEFNNLKKVIADQQERIEYLEMITAKPDSDVVPPYVLKQKLKAGNREIAQKLEKAVIYFVNGPNEIKFGTITTVNWCDYTINIEYIPKSLQLKTGLVFKTPILKLGPNAFRYEYEGTEDPCRVIKGDDVSIIFWNNGIGKIRCEDPKVEVLFRYLTR